MKTIVTLSLAALCAFASLPASATNPDTGVPHLYRSPGTTISTPPRFGMVTQEGGEDVLPVRLVASPEGRTTVSFGTSSGGLAPYSYLGFDFALEPAPFVVSVLTDSEVAGIQVYVGGAEITPIAGYPGYSLVKVPSSPLTGLWGPSVVVRLERSLAATAQVRVGLHKWAPCGQGFPPECGRPLDELPEIFGFGGMMRGLADVTVPAVMRKEGLHGPIRTDLSFSNPAGAMVMAILQLVGSGGGYSNGVPLELPAHQRVRIHDVVSWLRERGMSWVPDEGMLRIQGFVPAHAGDLTVETYYDGGASGRVGTSMPYFVEGEARRTGVLATSPADGDPRVTIYSALAGGTPVRDVDPLSFRLRIVSPDGTAESHPFAVDANYLSQRLSGYVAVPVPGSDFAVESDDPALRVLIVHSDGVSGSPSVIAGPLVQSTVP